MPFYASLDELLDWWAPFAWQVDVEHISDEVKRIGVLDRDFRYTVWIATLSLDQRWTLSPVGGPWQGTPVRIVD